MMVTVREMSPASTEKRYILLLVLISLKMPFVFHLRVWIDYEIKAKILLNEESFNQCQLTFLKSDIDIGTRKILL